MKKSYVLAAVILMLTTGIFAQVHGEGDNGPIVFVSAQNPSGEKSETFTYVERLPTSFDPVKAEDMRFFTVMAESAAVVKGAPYTATAVTETTQTLSDGNHIVHKNTASLARDSEGRTRREESGVKIGALQGNGPKIVSIHDPVGHTEYIFQPDGPNGAGKAIIKSGEGLGVGIGVPGGAVKPKMRTFTISKGDGVHSVEFGTTNERGTKTWVTPIGENGEDADIKHESLGTQTIEGVTAEGTRETRTIPAGAIGNEKPIVITSEVWTSPDLQMVVLSKRNDPRFGETVYKLTGITRGEPDPSLFQPPSNLRQELHERTKY